MAMQCILPLPKSPCTILCLDENQRPTYLYALAQSSCLFCHCYPRTPCCCAKVATNHVVVPMKIDVTFNKVCPQRRWLLVCSVFYVVLGGVCSIPCSERDTTILKRVSGVLHTRYRLIRKTTHPPSKCNFLDDRGKSAKAQATRL